jgi:hypothetical protein
MDTTGSKVLDGFWKLSALIEAHKILDAEVTSASTFGYTKTPTLQISAAAWARLGFTPGADSIPDDEHNTDHFRTMVDECEVVAIVPRRIVDGEKVVSAIPDISREVCDAVRAEQP